MFCRVCGESNDESSLYCSRDGEVLQKSNDSFNMVSGDGRFCKVCGEGVSKSDLYCSNCGNSLYTVEEVSSTSKLVEDVKEGSYLKGFNVKNLIKYSLIAVGIILIISIISSNFLNDALLEAIAEDTDMYLDQRIIGFLDVSTILNVSSLKMNLLSGGSSLFNFNFKGMFFLSTLVPIAIFSIMGAYISSRSKKKRERFGFKEYAFIGISYGIIMGLLSIFASRTVDFNIPYLVDYTEFGSLQFIKEYSFLSTLIKASLISIFSLALGSGVYSFFSGFKRKSFSPLAVASITLLASSVFAFLFVIFTSRSDGMFFTSYGEDWNMIVIAQLFVYTLLLINMASFNFSFEGEKMSVSLFNNMEELKESFAGIQYIYIGLFITMLLFFLYGSYSKKRVKDKREVLFTSLIFGLGLGILAYLSNITISMNSFMGNMFDSVGFMSLESGPISTAMGGFVIAALSALAGYFLVSGENKRVEENE